VVTEDYQEVTPGMSRASHLEWEMRAGLRCPLRVPRRSRRQWRAQESRAAWPRSSII